MSDYDHGSMVPPTIFVYGGRTGVMPDPTDNGDLCAWVYGGIIPVIEADCLVAIDVTDDRGRVRVRVPWEDVEGAWDGFVKAGAEMRSRMRRPKAGEKGEALSYRQEVKRPPPCYGQGIPVYNGPEAQLVFPKHAPATVTTTTGEAVSYESDEDYFPECH